MDGYLASFARGYFDSNLFDDRLYLRVRGDSFNEITLPGATNLSATPPSRLTRAGSFFATRRIELTGNGDSVDITLSNALLGRATGKTFKGGAEFCRDCVYCCLVYVEDDTRARPAFYRRFYCLRGVTDPEYCPVSLSLQKPGKIPSKKEGRF